MARPEFGTFRHHLFPIKESTGLSIAYSVSVRKDEVCGALTDKQEDDESDKELVSMDAFLACPASQLLKYQDYISECSPFWTQQGVKGAEFDRVLVVLDDAENTHFQFSYEKYLGLKRLSEIDQKQIDAGGG